MGNRYQFHGELFDSIDLGSVEAVYLPLADDPPEDPSGIHQRNFSLHSAYFLSPNILSVADHGVDPVIGPKRIPLEAFPGVLVDGYPIRRQPFHIYG